MATGNMIGATQVLDGSGNAIAPSRQGNDENRDIDLAFAKAGANDTLRDAGGQTCRCIAKSAEPPGLCHVAVAG